MKFYITEETKQELEVKIENLNQEEWSPYRDGQLDLLKDILESSVVIPVEESWDKAVPDGMEEDTIFDYIQDNFKNGLIIQPKQ